MDIDDFASSTPEFLSAGRLGIPFAIAHVTYRMP